MVNASSVESLPKGAAVTSAGGAGGAAGAAAAANGGDESKQELKKVMSHFTHEPRVVEKISELYNLDEKKSLGKGSFGEVLCGHPIDDPEQMYVPCCAARRVKSASGASRDAGRSQCPLPLLIPPRHCPWPGSPSSC